jgi:acyl carrier protein
MAPKLLDPCVARPAALGELLDWLNQRFANGGAPITEDTRLFAEGRVDSIGILYLIAWVERASGATIPDRLIRVDHFETPAAIAERFLLAESAPKSETSR